MKAVCVVFLAMCAGVLATQDTLAPHQPIPEVKPHDFGGEYTTLLETASKLQGLAKLSEDPAAGGAGGGSLATYLPDSGPYDNPATDTQPIQTIPSSPSCTVRGQTIFEIRKMRADAKQIGMSIMYEIQTMEKRKAYIEQMTAYLNDRIRELNKVKRDLAAEQKWIQVSNSRIAELAQKEKLIKLQDVMSCIKSEETRLQGEQGTKTVSLSSLTKQAAALEGNIKAIRKNMETVTMAAGKEAAGQPAQAPAEG